MTLLKDPINIPERVHQGDFVLKLSEGAHSTRLQAECKSGFAALITSDLLPLLPLQPPH